MFDETVFYILTRNRTAKQLTARALPNQVLERTIFVCPPEDKAALVSEFPFAPVLTGEWRNLSEKRQWVYEQAVRQEQPYIFMLDDDLKFRETYFQSQEFPADEWPEPRELPPLRKHRATTKENLLVGFQMMHDWLRLGHASTVSLASQRLFHNYTESYMSGARPHGISGYSVTDLQSAGCVFNRLVAMSEFDVLLTLLRQGYGQLVCLEYTVDQISNAKGGCSIYRTGEVKAEAAKGLQALHPTCVRTTLRKSKWNGIGCEHLDVTILWRKAKGEGLLRRAGELAPLDYPVQPPLPMPEGVDLG